MAKNPPAAILTGDLIASRRAAPGAVDAALSALAAAAAEIGGWSGAPPLFTRFRGDGWQMHLGRAGLCLDAVLCLTARLTAARTGLSTRIAIGVGDVERLGQRDLSDAAGEAFVLSGQALDRMPKGQRIALAHPRLVLPWHRAVFDLALFQAARWSPEQAEAVALALGSLHGDAPLTQEQMAARLGVTRQAVQARLRTAGWAAMTGALEALHRHDWTAEAPA